MFLPKGFGKSVLSVISTGAVLVPIALAFNTPAWSYDVEMAQIYAKLFAPVQGAKAGKAIHLMKPVVFVNKIKANEKLIVLDIRTAA